MRRAGGIKLKVVVVKAYGTIYRQKSSSNGCGFSQRGQVGLSDRRNDRLCILCCRGVPFSGRDLNQANLDTIHTVPVMNTLAELLEWGRDKKHTLLPQEEFGFRYHPGRG